MPHLLKNDILEVHIDNPLENYNAARFDWTGKIARVKYQNKLVTTNELMDGFNKNQYGRGFYNEFGIDTALGFDETPIGGWFHKIGIGILKKEDDSYLFNKDYHIIPAEFEIYSTLNKLSFSCKSKEINGYEYLLKKEFELRSDGFSIHYQLRNTGEKEIATDEYTHNFIALKNQVIGKEYVLRFPFDIYPENFGAWVDPERKVKIYENEFGFKGRPKEQFFFSNLSGGENVQARWDVVNLKTKIGIRESCDFETNKINLWGWGHVISPELFYNISVQPGQSSEWTRKFKIYQLET